MTYKVFFTVVLIEYDFSEPKGWAFYILSRQPRGSPLFYKGCTEQNLISQFNVPFIAGELVK